MCRHVDCHHQVVCLLRIPFQQWLQLACPCDKSKTILTTDHNDHSHHCQLTDHDIVDQPCDCYQETETGNTQWEVLLSNQVN